MTWGTWQYKFIISNTARLLKYSEADCIPECKNL